MEELFFFEGVTIQTLSYPATELNYPAITMCRTIPYNPDEYIRAVYDNFQMACNSCNDTAYCEESCEETKLLRQDFKRYISLNLVRKIYQISLLYNSNIIASYVNKFLGGKTIRIIKCKQTFLNDCCA